VRLSARVDYAVRAALELAAAEPETVTSERIAEAQQIPSSFLVNVLADLRRAGLVRSERGAAGGYRLGRAADEVTVADVIRAVQGNLADVHGERPEQLRYDGAAERLREVWVAARASYRAVLEQVTLAEIAGDRLPEAVRKQLERPGAWESWAAL
jgi:Rrf2 family protein